MDKRYQVFVSSTYKDLLEHRQLVIKALMQLTAIPAGMELFPAADDDAWTLIQRAIDESDYYLVIIGGRYGSVDKDGLSFTEKEYDYAEAKGKPIMAFLHEKPDGLPREHTETDPEAWKKLQAFREKAKQRHCKFWKSREELIIGVLTSYQQLTYTHPAAGWVRGDQAKTIEDVERLAELQQQVAELTAENRRLQTLSKDDTSMFQQGDDKLCLTVYSNKRNQQKQTRTIQITWNEVLKALGPSFLRTCMKTVYLADKGQYGRNHVPDGPHG